MIEIIKKPNRKYLGKCQCGCEFTFEEEDITVEKEAMRHCLDPLSELKLRVTKYIQCPYCKLELEFKENKFEELFKEE